MVLDHKSSPKSQKAKRKRCTYDVDMSADWISTSKGRYINVILEVFTFKFTSAGVSSVFWYSLMILKQ